MTSREYYAQNRDKVQQRNREYYLRNREKILEQARAYREQNVEREREKGSAYYRLNREKILEDRRDYYQRNGSEVRNRVRAYTSSNRARIQADEAWRRHGIRPEDWAELREAQGGRCYLCGEDLSGRVVVDHDHSCCPRQRSCAICRRGLVHNLCNVTIGFADDDPARLRFMADALEAAQALVTERLAGKPVQLEMGA
jgi:hypothetical protein